MLFYRSPAKINLSLDVLSRRADGYHELQSVTHCIGLFDTLGLDLTGAPGLSFRCSSPALGGNDNLCLKAARAWLQATKTLEGQRRYFPGIRLTLDKKIPVGAGLGGGSSNATATLLALNDHFKTPLEDAQLHEIATGLGADVPLFLHGGCALMEGIGEKISDLPALSGWIV
jgi:4-diphosphocytidyl-2-C-methyl-D-erythritol kinase